MKQIARNVTGWDGELEGARFLIHDRDTKFTEAFDEHFRRDDGGPVLTPYGAPVANCFAESWIGSLKRECLNYFLCFDFDQLDYILRAWVCYYNTQRPHRGIGMNNEVLDTKFAPQSHGAVRCRQQLGGIIKSYYREAA